MNALVTGGAGYIGSHMVRRLLDDGGSVVVVDDLSSGHRESVPRDVPLVVADVGDRAQVERALREHRIDVIFHFAAHVQVGESVRDPRLYYRNNLGATLGLVDAALDCGVPHFVLSSTAAVYGTPESVPISEDHPTRPINPYGETKLSVEKMLAAYSSAYGLSYGTLRYFNAAGANVEAGLGERHDPETHLIPLVLQAALGLRPHVTVFGRDYPTPDGTCVRDYIHVMDLVDAHLAALRYLQRGGASGVFNLGTGTGHSVAEVIETCRKVTGREIAVRYGARREGDPPALIAAAERAQRTLSWRPERSSIERIVRDAWAWHAARRGAADSGGARGQRRTEHAHAR